MEHSGVGEGRGAFAKNKPGVLAFAAPRRLVIEPRCTGCQPAGAAAPAHKAGAGATRRLVIPDPCAAPAHMVLQWFMPLAPRVDRPCGTGEAQGRPTGALPNDPD